MASWQTAAPRHCYGNVVETKVAIEDRASQP